MIFHVNRLLDSRITWNVKLYFLLKDNFNGHTNHRNTGILPKYQNTMKNIGIPEKDTIKDTNIGFN